MFTSRQNPNDPDSTRPSTATQNAPPHCVVGATDLATVVAAWPELPEAIKAGILAMIKASRR
jgi:hypothetical protein